MPAIMRWWVRAYDLTILESDAYEKMKRRGGGFFSSPDGRQGHVHCLYQNK